MESDYAIPFLNNTTPTDGTFVCDWFTQIARSSVGYEVQLHMKNGGVYEGILKTLSPQMDVMLEFTLNLGNDIVVPVSMNFSASEILSISAVNGCLNTAIKGLSDSAVRNHYYVEQIEKDFYQGPHCGLQNQNTDGTFAPDWITQVAMSSVGCKVELHLKNGGRYEGVVKSLSQKMDVELEVSDKNYPRNGCPKIMYFKASEITTISALTQDAVGKESFTDGAISKSSLGDNDKDVRQLIAWQEADNGNDFRIEDQNDGWDPNEMFRINEERFGVKSTYDASLSMYTTPLDKTSKQYEQRKKLATQVANKIESSLVYQRRIALENAVEDEEDRFSAVKRPDKVINESETKEDLNKEKKIDELLHQIEQMDSQYKTEMVHLKDQLQNLKDKHHNELISIQTQLSLEKEENVRLKGVLEKQDGQSKLSTLSRDPVTFQTECVPFIGQESQEIGIEAIEKEEVLDEIAKTVATTETQTEELECLPKKKKGKSLEKKIWRHLLGCFTPCISKKE